jgi:hypothetical protein
MATTTNYGWTTPDDTALVKDGASAIRTLGSSVDTTTKALNPSTTLGDIEYRSSTANTNTRLGIGTTGQVLAVSGGVPAWSTVSSGGMTLLSTTTLSGATVTISSISQSYKSLVGVVYGVTNATGNGWFRIAPNGTTNITTQTISNTAATFTYVDTDYFFLARNSSTLDSPSYTVADNVWSFQIDNYTNTSARKSISTYGGYISDNSTPASRPSISFGCINTNSAISSLVFSNNGGNLSTGTVLLYGVS